MKKREEIRHRSLYDGSVWKVIVLASAWIVLSTSLIGWMSYRITRQEVIQNLKTNDLPILARSVASQVEGRIGRAIETSRLLADNPAVEEWVQGGERDERLGLQVKRVLADLSGRYDYANAFVASGTTGQYWTESGEVLGVLGKDKPEDDWFFQTLEAGRKSNVSIDWNASRQDTFVFVNVLIGSVSRPLGVAGIGLSLKKLSEDFADYKLLEGSRVWMIGGDGTIWLSDDYALTGSNISDRMTDAALTQWRAGDPAEAYVFEADDLSGQLVDMIRYPIQSADARLLVQIPRSRTTGFLGAIANNSTAVAVVSLILSLYFFNYISRRMADPYQRALELNKQLEGIVEDRTRALADKNREMTESVAYANRIQQSVLPAEETLGGLFSEHLTYWRPRDGVGGDFYWVKRVRDALWIAAGDCSGHGVPGALMTMLSVSLLDRIVEQDPDASPGQAMSKLNVMLKDTLGQTAREGLTDDGLDLGLMRVCRGRAAYAGTGIVLFVRDERGMRAVKGDRPGIGYRRTPGDTVYTDHEWPAGADVVYYMTTDGVPDQNGGPKNLSLGKTRLAEWLASYRDLPLTEQRRRFEEEMSAFMGQEDQRDDMMLIGFKLKV